MADYRSLIAKYFPADQVNNALRVMAGESSGNPTAHATKGEDSRGLFQINVAAGANPDLARYNLYDPETNIRIAAQMYRDRGWQPWTVARQLGLTADGKQPQGGDLMADPFDAYLDEILAGEGNPVQESIRRGGQAPPPPVADDGRRQENPILSQLQAIKGPWIHVGRVPVKQSGDIVDAALSEGAYEQDPTYRYQFADGTYVDIGGPADTVIGGTAIKDLADTTQKAAPRYFPGEGGSEQMYDPVTGETKPIYTPPVDTSKKPYLRNETGEQMPNEDYVPTSTFEDTDGNERVLRDRLTGRIISRLGPIVAKPGEGTFTHGNKVYKWDANGQPVPIYEFPAGANADAVQWATLAQRKAEFEAKQRADAEAAERAWQQFVEQQAREDKRNRLTNTTNFTNDILSTWTKAAPMAMLPGQQYFLGGEPGGLASKWAEMNRHAFDPNLLKPAPIQIDPNEAWRQAQGLLSGGK